jgi:RHH-type proline utilization regulon transcriptional repressor/proline dehydrogenase/delta 1-pyrroline-5-carboxylate dehydrogenase
VTDWPSHPEAIVGPLITPPHGPLQRALTTLEPGERWLVEPRRLGDDRLWSPGVKIGVAAGSWFHMTECFGPVLGVMRARDLDHAIEMQNATPFGLTGGIHSLDPAEIRHWLDHVQVGNAYVNRHITGAIVQRQPFGGWKRSAIGAGAKAGGADYVLGLSIVRDPVPIDPAVAVKSYEDAWQEWFGAAHDPTGLRSERNVLRYRPLDGVVLRIDDSTAGQAIVAARAAASRCGVTMHVSHADRESEQELLEWCTRNRPERVRALVPVSSETRLALLGDAITVDTTPISAEGRFELTRWTKEQAVSETTHRHGRLIASVFDA